MSRRESIVAGNALRELVRALEGATPTPAGGAAAAVAVAQGIALLLKASRLSRAADAPRHALESRLASCCTRAVTALEADCRAFEGVLEMRRAQEQGLDRAWVQATEVPLELVAIATEALLQVPAVRDTTKPALFLDVDAAIELLRAGVSIALANARGNLASIHEDAARERLRSASERAGEAAGTALEAARARG